MDNAMKHNFLGEGKDEALTKQPLTCRILQCLVDSEVFCSIAVVPFSHVDGCGQKEKGVPEATREESLREMRQTASYEAKLKEGLKFLGLLEQVFFSKFVPLFRSCIFSVPSTIPLVCDENRHFSRQPLALFLLFWGALAFNYSLNHWYLRHN